MTTINSSEKFDTAEIVPVLPIRDLIVYPFMILPLFVGREMSKNAVHQAIEKNNRIILLVGQKDIAAENPLPSDLYEVGTLAMIMRVKGLPDGRLKILIQGLTKAKICSFENSPGLFSAHIQKIEATPTPADPIATEALMRNAREQLEKIISIGKLLSPDILIILEDIQDPGRLSDLIASNLNLKVAEAQEILETIDPIERLHKINQILGRELNIILYKNRMKDQEKSSSLFNKDDYIKDQIQSIKNELNDEFAGKNNTDELSEFREKVQNGKLPELVKKESLKQLARLEKMHAESSEASILRSYIECVIELPWDTVTPEEIDLEHAKNILDEDHFNLLKIKERILEFLAVKLLRGESLKGPILCFIGPPGVGKTSLGKSIAKATGRTFVRISLGGLKDEAEIRGHRRTYVGAMPGRFIQAMQQAKSLNPVVVLDEIDKLGSDFKGDPSSALLEVLDPEQNHTFRDHYLNLPFDLSKTMFIATANTADTIPSPLRDRMEILYLSGYTEEEKLTISERFLVPKQLEENGINREQIHFQRDGLIHVIRHYTAEAGLRNLERQIGSLCRKIAKRVACGINSTCFEITHNSVEELLGPPLYNAENDHFGSEVGLATGLAWTVSGGETLHIEASKMRGKGLTLTGHLGEVMKESALTAIGHIRANAFHYGIPEEFFEHHEIHVHVPAGATPKDGPSAGITLALAMISLITNCPIDNQVAMTGEITLTGRVLPVGGIKEKSLAAMRKGIRHVIIPEANKKDLLELPEEYRNQVNFIPVSHIHEVLAVALIDWDSHLKKITKKSRLKKTAIKPAIPQSDAA